MSDDVQLTWKYAADLVLFAQRQGELVVLLIERGWDPHKGKLALPGGHVEIGETSEAAARRECYEETGIEAPQHVALVGVYDAVDRDIRGRYVSAARSAVLPDLPVPVAGDDACAASWEPVHRVLEAGQLAFDHHRILVDAVAVQAENIGALLHSQH